MKELKSIEKNKMKLSMMEKNGLYFLVKRDAEGNEITSLPLKSFDRADQGFAEVLETL